MDGKVLRRAIALAVTGALAALTGCLDRGVAVVNLQQYRQQTTVLPASTNRDIDILFVIDDSPSMAKLEANLDKNFPKFIQVLESSPGGLPNLHIGVVSTDVGNGGATFSHEDPHCDGDGDDGAFQNKSCGMRTDPFHIDGSDYGKTPLGCDTSCSGPTDPWLVDTNGGKTVNFTGSLADTFSCIANLGDWGCGFEMHLEAMRRAFDYVRNPQNRGFLRKDAYLAVIFLANEDDCSVSDSTMLDPSKTSTFGAYASYRCTRFGVLCQPDGDAPGPRTNCMPRDDSAYMYHVEDYVTFLKSLKSDPRKLIVAGITGNSTPLSVGTTASGNPVLDHSCVSSNGYADPAVRINWFLKQFPGRNTFQSVCADDLTPALIQIAQLLAHVDEAPCLPGDLVDASGNPVAGTSNQPDCQVSDVENKGQPDEKETVIAACNAGKSNAPCWYAKRDTASCGDRLTQLSLVIDRGGRSAPDNDQVVAHCAAR